MSHLAAGSLLQALGHRVHVHGRGLHDAEGVGVAVLAGQRVVLAQAVERQRAQALELGVEGAVLGGGHHAADELGVLLVDRLAGRSQRGRRGGVGVHLDDLDLAAVDPAGRVDLVGGELPRRVGVLPELGQGTARGRDDRDLDGLPVGGVALTGALRATARGQQAGHGQSGDDERRTSALHRTPRGCGAQGSQ